MLRSRLVLLHLAAFCLVALTLAGTASASSPGLSIIQPRGAQRGTEVNLIFSGARLKDAQEILFHTPGFEVTKLEVKADNRVDATVKIAPDCQLGEHAMRVRTATGISDLRTFYVGNLPEVKEKEPNTEFTEPQPIELNVTVDGVIQSEDVDYFVVECKKGQRLSVEVEAIRLGRVLFDPFVAILDQKRFELATADDTPLVYQDCVAQIKVPEDGRYVVMIRDSAYSGNGAYQYRLHVGTFPRPLAVIPAGGKLGEEVEVRFIGDVLGDFTRKIKLPEQMEENFGLLAEENGLLAPSANPFRLFEHGNDLEQEPNDDRNTASSATLPNAFNGIISQAGDADNFKFAAKKGETYEVRCHARSIRSPLDPVMTLYQADGKRIAGNDDTGGPDSYFRFRAPVDGDYIVHVADHLNRGGPEFSYRIEFTPIVPEVALSMPSFRRYAQDRQHIAVPRGNRYAMLFNVSRRNFNGELAVKLPDLPPGVTAEVQPIPQGQSSVPVLFEAKADAPVAGTLVDLQAVSTDEKTPATGRLSQDAQFIRGNPGQSIYWSYTSKQLPVAVTDAVPFRIELIQPKVPIVQNGSMQLKVQIVREEGFDKPVKLELMYKPTGIGSVPYLNVKGDANEADYPINANSKAPIGTSKILIVGSSDVTGNVYVSSAFIDLEVAAPFVTFAMQRGAVEQGKETEVFCKLEQQTAFEGAAKVQLVGLPAKVTSAEMEITKDSKDVAFKIVTEPESPVGNHKNIIGQLVVMKNGEPIVHNVGATQLRIDKPLPPKKDTPAPKPKAEVAKKPDPKPAPPKQLSRLEKLRLEAKERAEAAAGGGGAE